MLISFAISVSLILASAACVFSAALFKFLIVCSSLFWIAPRLDLCVDTCDIALSIFPSVVSTSLADFTLMFSTKSPFFQSSLPSTAVAGTAAVFPNPLPDSTFVIFIEASPFPNSKVLSIPY